MSAAPRTVGELLASLEAAGSLPPGAAAAIHEGLSRPPAAPAVPWYVQALIGMAAWVAAIALVLAVGIALDFNIEDGILIVLGLVLGGVGVAAHWYERGIFAAQGSLALCLAGEVCILIGVGESMGHHDGVAGVFAAAALLAAGLYFAHRSPIQRFCSVLIAAICGIVWILDGGLFRGDATVARGLVLDAFLLVEAAAAGWILLREEPPGALRPLVYALAVAVLGTMLILSFGWEGDDVRAGWLAQMGMAAGGLAALARLAGGAGALGREPLSIVVAATILLAFASNAGILAALAFLVVAYARGETLLVGLSLAFLPLFLVSYYYDLDVTLLRKSGILVASGLVLLGLRSFLANRPWAREGKP